MISFSRVVGHRRQTMLLSRAIARDTLPPTLLFAGPAGIGKFAVARAVAAALNCQSPVLAADARRESIPRGAVAAAPSGEEERAFPVDACGRCRSCDRVRRFVHVDVLTLEPDDKASIKIDATREVLERTAFRPFEGRRRVVIIRDAETLEVQAQNALLKSLEEPPASTVFVLTSAVPGMLLPTVRSRCMHVRFAALTEREVADVLIRDHGLTPDDARSRAALASGRIGEALSLGSTDVAVLRESALLLLQQAAATRSATARLQAAAVVATTPGKKERPREEVALLLRIAASILRDVELLNSGADTRVLANPVIADELSRLTRGYTGDRARAAFAAVDRALAAVERNVGTKVVSEWLAVQL